MIHLSHNPDKLEAKALAYERKGKTNKAIKCREKAARLRGSAGGLAGAHPVGVAPLAAARPAIITPISGAGVAGVAPLTAVNPHTSTYVSARTPAMYEANALKWEQRGNWEKAQKNREKVWRLRNPSYQTAPAPAFYRNNSFLGYDLQPSMITNLPGQIPLGGAPLSHGAPMGLGVPGAGAGFPLGKKKYDPVLIEAKAADYERRGKTKKAMKLRDKAARVRAGTYTSTRTPNTWEANALKWEQRGNWEKAQRNRAKYWRYQNPQYASQQAPMFYNNNKFLGYNIPLTGAPLLGQGGHGLPPVGLGQPLLGQGGHGLPPVGLGQPLLGQGGHGLPPVGLGQPFLGQGGHGLPPVGLGQPLLGQGGHGIPPVGLAGLDMMRPSRDPARLEARAADWERRGKPQKAARLRNKAMQLRAGSYTSHRTPEMYERNALKWEQRGNWEKAQKNRAKAWRMKNPQYAQHIGPNFYNNGSFLGYSVPFTASETTLLPYYRTTSTYTTTTGMPGMHTSIPGMHTGMPIGAGGMTHLLPSRDPARLEARAIEAERKGKREKAMKLRAKAAKIAAGGHTPRSPAMMEAKALQYEQQGNWKRAQKLREKVWRLSNPQYITVATAPSFYSNNTFLGYNVPFAGMQTIGVTGVTSAMSTMHVGGTQTVYAAPIVQQVVRPTIVTETARPEKIIEVQPIIHREVEAPTLKIIEQHVYETVPSVGPNTITNAAIVHETVTPHITEEVQSIVHREVPAPFIERVEQHVTEHIVNPVIQTKEVIQDPVVHTGVAVHTGIAAGAPVGVSHGGIVTGGAVVGGVVQTQTLVGAPVVTEQTTVTTTTTQQPGLF